MMLILSQSEMMVAFIEDVWNRERIDAVDRFLKNDCLVNDLDNNEKLRGKRLFYGIILRLKNWSSNIHFEVLEVAVEENLTLVKWRAHGDVHNPWASPFTSQRSIEIEGKLVARVRDGLIEELWLSSNIEQRARDQRNLRGDSENLDSGATTNLDMRTYGTPGGVPLLLFPTHLLPGWWSWGRFLKKFGASRTVITFNYLINRLSYEAKQVPADYGIRFETRAVARTLNCLGCSEPVDVVAWSNGGCIALEYALANPERVRSVSLIEPTVLSCLSHQELDSAMQDLIQRRRQDWPPDIEVTSAQLADSMVDMGLCPDVSAAKAHEYWPLLSAYSQVVKYRSTVFKYEFDLDRIRKFDKPVLLFRGSKSLPFYTKIVNSLSRELPNVQVAELNGSHRSHYEDEARFTELLRAFHAQQTLA